MSAYVQVEGLGVSFKRGTATSEVLKVISSSPGDLGPVFEAMLANATRICEAKFGTLYRYDGELLSIAAQMGTPPEFAEFQRRRGAFRVARRSAPRLRAGGGWFVGDGRRKRYDTPLTHSHRGPVVTQAAAGGQAARSH